STLPPRKLREINVVVKLTESDIGKRICVSVSQSLSLPNDGCPPYLTQILSIDANCTMIRSRPSVTTIFHNLRDERAFRREQPHCHCV
ncbi:hypothetical protein RB213_016193, partial [Colletotrichum asianum]